MLALRAEDVLVASGPVSGLSARNAYAATLTAIEPLGRDVTLRCAIEGDGGELLARVTPAAVRALGLRPGQPVWLFIKSHSIRVL